MLQLQGFRSAVKERLPLTVVTHFFIYAAGKIAMSGISVIMAPIMMLLLSPAEYGLLSLIHSFNNIAIACIGLGLPQVLMVEYFHAQDISRTDVLNSIMATFFICSVPIIAGCILFPQIIQNFLFLPVSHITLVYAIVCVCFFSFCNDIMYQVLQYHRYAFFVTVLQLSAAVCIALMNVVSIGYYHCGVAAVIWSECCISSVVACVGLFLYCKNRLYMSIDYAHIQRRIVYNIKLGVPLLSSAVVCWFFGLLNRWLIIRYVGLKEAGVFAVADAGGLMLYRLVLHPLQGSYGPALLDSYGKNGQEINSVEKSNQRVMFLAITAMLAMAIVGYFMFKSFFYFIVPTAYVQSIDCLLGILIGYILLIGAYFASNFLQFQKKRWIFIIAIGFAACINVVLNILMVPVYGLSGAVFAMASGYAAYFGVLLLYNRILLDKYCA